MPTGFNLALTKNFIKLTLVTIAALSSTLGLRTELTIILNDVSLATWLSICWVFIMITVIGYYKAKADVELEKFRENEKNRQLMGFTQQKPIYTTTVTTAPAETKP
jgi:hypothetical protein